MSRKITEEAVEAFLAGKPFSKSNTTVAVDDEGVVTMTLFGNIIAKRYTDAGFSITTAGWNSTTTRERLNGLPGVSVNKSRGQLYLNGTRWDGTSTVIVKL